MHPNAMKLPPCHETMSELAPRLARGSLTAQDLITDCRAQIAAHDRQGAALATLICQCVEADDEACRSDIERGRAGTRWILQGIPIVLKDNIDLQGYPSTSGNRAMGRAVARCDAEQTRRLRQAGAIILAKTNMSEFSFDLRSRSSVAGDVLNPFDRSVTAGGSSGGTAAAIAAGFAIAGLGTDTGGSIRVPAAFNGLVGLRPTHGLIDLGGVAPLAPTTDTVGPIARCVADIASLLAIMSGAPDAARPFSLPQAPQRLRGARIGILRQAFGTDPEINAVMEGALATMASAGAVLVDPVGLLAEVLPVGRPLVVDWEFRTAFDGYLRDNFASGTAPVSLAQIYAAGDYLPEHRESLLKRLSMSTVGSQSYREVLEYHQTLRGALVSLMNQHRLTSLVYPTSWVMPESLDNPAVGWAPELAACCGWPALTLPVGRSSRGLPIGLEFLGRAHSEPELLGMAYDLECRGPGRFIPDLRNPDLRIPDLRNVGV